MKQAISDASNSSEKRGDKYCINVKHWSIYTLINLNSAIPRNVIIASFGPLNYPLEKRQKVAKIFNFLTQKITKVLKIATTGILIVALAWFRFFSIVLQSQFRRVVTTELLK